jgi:NADH kinase
LEGRLVPFQFHIVPSLILSIILGPDSERIDLVVTLGGDGTILHASSLFSAGAVPPVLSFSMGTLGFLLPFRKFMIEQTYQTILSPSYLDIDDFDKALESVFTGKATILNRMRLACTFYDTELMKKEDQNGSVFIERGTSTYN